MVVLILGYFGDYNVDSIISCEVCFQSFKNQGSLIHHMSVHKGITTCRVCGKVQSRVANLKRHLARVHQVDMDLNPLNQEAIYDGNF